MIRYEGLRDLLDCLARTVRHRLWIGRSAVCAIDEHAVEDFTDQTKPDAAALPIVTSGDRPRQGTDIRRQCRPEDDEIQMAGMIGEIDTLSCFGLAVDPADVRAADERGKRSKHRGDEGLATLVRGGGGISGKQRVS